jgi:hypothetical protein
MQPRWLDPAAYNDLDLARTVVSLDAFSSQARTADGRGLETIDPPTSVRAALEFALTALGEAATGTFGELCNRLSASSSHPQWRAQTDEVLRAALSSHADYTQERRAERQSSLHGTVVGLHTSNGGVPKKPIPRVHVTDSGIDGDQQAARQHNGRPWQALCIWSAETIDILRNEGHAIAPGLAGENITLSGIDWREAVCGAQLQVGEMVAELTLTALPCKKNAQWFNDKNFNRMHHAVATGVTRMYAAVVQPGHIEVGDTATLHLR